MYSSRQLTAIMFADIAGYTAMMQEDEALAMQLRHKLQKKLEEEVPIHHGRILEFRGDGALCSFTSTIEAVRAAVAGRKEDAQKIIMEVEAGEVLGGNDYRGMAMVYAALGENGMAFKWLEKSYDKHEESLCSLKIDPKMDPLRSDQRFNTLLRKIGLEE